MLSKPVFIVPPILKLPSLALLFPVPASRRPKFKMEFIREYESMVMHLSEETNFSQYSVIPRLFGFLQRISFGEE